MSQHVHQSSPSQTMTWKQFEQISNREAGIKKLERVAAANLHNTLRILKHNRAYNISFYRMSSKLIPLATHKSLEDWNYIAPLQEHLVSIGNYAKQHNMRIDFHPDHFVVLNTPDKEKLLQSLHVLRYHYRLLKAMGIDPAHRCVLHIGGSYQNKEKSLERFIHNWAYVPPQIQQMIMLENDDTTFHVENCLYITEKLGIPFVFDLHHHLANHTDKDWQQYWPHIVNTWRHSPLPIKMHLSSPRSNKQFRSHADYINVQTFMQFMMQTKGSAEQIDCMIEAKQKDEALFQLMRELAMNNAIDKDDPSNITLR